MNRIDFRMEHSLITRRAVLAAGLATFVSRETLASNTGSYADNLGSYENASGAYAVDLSFLENAGWKSPVAPSAGNLLWTNKAYDYRSLRYIQIHRPPKFNAPAHGGVDFVGSPSAYTEATSVFAIGRGTVREIKRLEGSQNLSRIYVEHQASNGQAFLALYLHCYAKSTLAEGNVVESGEFIGTLRSYNSPIHLHFQIDTKLSRRSTGGYEAGSTQDPTAFLIGNPGSGNELTAAESQKRWYAPYLANAIHLGVVSNSNDRAWKIANVPVTRGELVSIVKAFAESYQPGFINSLPSLAGVDRSTVFIADDSLRGSEPRPNGSIPPSSHLDNVTLFALKGIVSASNPFFRTQDFATIGEAILMMWKAFRLTPVSSDAVTAYLHYRSKMQHADVDTPMSTNYLLPLPFANAESYGYKRTTDLSLVKNKRIGWRQEKILTLDFFNQQASDKTGYSLCATRAILSKVGVNLIKYLAMYGSSAAVMMEQQDTNSDHRFTSPR